MRASADPPPPLPHHRHTGGKQEPVVGAQRRIAVLQQINLNSYRVRVGAREIVAHSTQPLPVGGKLVGTITVDRGRYVITIAGRRTLPAAARLLARLELADTPLAHIVAGAMVDAQLPLDPQIARRIERLLKERPGSEHRRRQQARIAAEAEQRGLMLPEEAIAQIVELLGGGADSGARDGRRHPDSDDHVESSSLEQQVRAAFRLGDVADHPLHLMNHIVGEGDHWVHIPFNARQGAQEVCGMLRIQIPHAQAIVDHGDRRIVWREAVIEVETPAGLAQYRLEPDGDEVRVVPRGDFSTQGAGGILAPDDEIWA